FNEQDESVKTLLNGGDTDISGLEGYSGYEKICELRDGLLNSSDQLNQESVEPYEIITAAQTGEDKLLSAFVSKELQINYDSDDSDTPEDEDERYDALMCDALWRAAFNEQDESVKTLLNGGDTDISGLEGYSGYKKILQLKEAMSSQRQQVLEQLRIDLFTAARSGRNLELLSELVQGKLGFSESELQKVIEDTIEIAAFNSQQGALIRLLEGGNIDVSSFREHMIWDAIQQALDKVDEEQSVAGNEIHTTLRQDAVTQPTPTGLDISTMNLSNLVIPTLDEFKQHPHPEGVDPALLQQYGHEAKIPEELLAASSPASSAVPSSAVDFATTPAQISSDPAEEKQKTLALIRDYYQRGLELYHSGDSANLALAAQELAQALRPTLSKPSMRSLHVNIADVKEELLDSMYHLGKIYLADSSYPDHHSKAAAIFQYCAGFARKHFTEEYFAQGQGGVLTIATSADDRKEFPSAEAAAEYFTNQAYLVENQFLVTLHSNMPAVTLINAEDTKAADLYCSSYHQQISGYKDSLAGIRFSTQDKLEEISDLTVVDIAQRAAEVAKIYSDVTRFFVRHERDVLHQDAQHQAAPQQAAPPAFVQQLLIECYEQLGAPPEGCEYAIVSLGSLASGTMTPWSGLEFAILINEDNESYREYFRNLTKLLHIKVINLGETPLRNVEIESLNNFKTANEADEWFQDEVMISGFNFDGSDWHARKLPFSQQGQQAENELDIEITIISDKPDYELILTPGQLAMLQREVGHSLSLTEPEHDLADSTPPDSDTESTPGSESTESWVSSDERLVQALRSISLIDGSTRVDYETGQEFRTGQGLLDSYRAHLRDPEILAPQILQERAMHILQEDVSKFSLKLSDEKKGNLVDVKKDFHRLGEVIQALSNYYNILAKDDSPAITIWEMIDVMEIRDNPILSPVGAQHLREALGIATELELSSYPNNEAQGEWMSTYVPTVENLSKEQRQQLVQQTFHIKDTSILHHFYYVMSKVRTIMDGFSKEESREVAERTLVTNDLFDASNYNKGMVHARFIEYDQALGYLKIAKTEAPESFELLKNLFVLHQKMKATEDALAVAEKMLRLSQAQHPDNPNHPDLAASYNSLGNAYDLKGNYDKAIEYHDLALTIRLQAYANSLSHPEIAASYNNLGNAYNAKGEYGQAIIYHKQALAIRQEAYVSNPNHPDLATSFNNLGNAYERKGEYDQAILYHEQALGVMQKAYTSTPHHPDLATSFNNLGNAYEKKGEYDQAIKYHDLALTIRLQAYANSPSHPDIAMSYNNLGNVYDSKGEYGQAIIYHKLALAIKLEAYASTPNHPDIAISHNNLGNAYYSKGEYDQAYEHAGKAVEIYFRNHHQQHLAIAKSVYDQIVLQLGNLALLDDSAAAAIEYYQQIDPNYEHIVFESEEFVRLQFEHAAMAYSSNALQSALNCQLVLVKIDPGLRHGNHYHNLASYYAYLGHIEKANITFTDALAQPPAKVTGRLHVEYAQFLIVNRDNEALATSVQEISPHLHAAISSDNMSDLPYGRAEKDSVCEILQNLLSQRNAAIQVNPKVLAYYLLIKYPECMQETNTPDPLLKALRSHCDNLQDEISFTLLADAYRSVGNEELAGQYTEQAALIVIVDDLITGKIKLTTDGGDIEPAMVQEFARGLGVTGSSAVSEGRLDDAAKSYAKLFKIYHEILTGDLKGFQAGANSLATIALLCNHKDLFLHLKQKFGAEINRELVELSGLDLLPLEQQIPTQLGIPHQAMQSDETLIQSPAEEEASSALGGANSSADDEG
ncbi:MAG: hypothetical protein COA94_03080, partial [Rickettsiales bacterium]